MLARRAFRAGTEPLPSPEAVREGWVRRRRKVNPCAHESSILARSRWCSPGCVRQQPTCVDGAWSRRGGLLGGESIVAEPQGPAPAGEGAPAAHAAGEPKPQIGRGRRYLVQE